MGARPPVPMLGAALLVACGGATGGDARGTSGRDAGHAGADAGADAEAGLGSSTGGGGGAAGGGGATAGDGAAPSSGGAGGSRPDASLAADAPDGGAGGALGDASLAPDAAPPPEDVASTQTVTFELTNVTGAPRYVVTGGWYCTPYALSAVSDAGASSLSLGLGMACPCECPVPGPAYANRLHAIAPGETYTVTWDARALVTFLTSVDCSSWGMPRGAQLTGAWQPVPPGTYQVTLGVESTLPPSCGGPGPEVTCSSGSSGSSFVSIASRCITALAATVVFSLPAAGDVTVPVDLP